MIPVARLATASSSAILVSRAALRTALAAPAPVVPLAAPKALFSTVTTDASVVPPASPKRPRRRSFTGISDDVTLSPSLKALLSKPVPGTLVAELELARLEAAEAAAAAKTEAKAAAADGTVAEDAGGAEVDAVGVSASTEASGAEKKKKKTKSKRSRKNMTLSDLEAEVSPEGSRLRSNHTVDTYLSLFPEEESRERRSLLDERNHNSALKQHFLQALVTTLTPAQIEKFITVFRRLRARMQLIAKSSQRQKLKEARIAEELAAAEAGEDAVKMLPPVPEHRNRSKTPPYWAKPENTSEGISTEQEVAKVLQTIGDKELDATFVPMDRSIAQEGLQLPTKEAVANPSTLKGWRALTTAALLVFYRNTARVFGSHSELLMPMLVRHLRTLTVSELERARERGPEAGMLPYVAAFLSNRTIKSLQDRLSKVGEGSILFGSDALYKDIDVQTQAHSPYVTSRLEHLERTAYKVFVTSIPITATTRELMQAFSRCGVVLGAEIYRPFTHTPLVIPGMPPPPSRFPRVPDPTTCHAFIYFADSRSRDRALHPAMQTFGVTLHDMPMYTHDPLQRSALILCNIRYRLSHSDVLAAMHYLLRGVVAPSQIYSLDLPMDMDRNRGRCIIRFVDHRSAGLAVRILNGAVLSWPPESSLSPQQVSVLPHRTVYPGVSRPMQVAGDRFSHPLHPISATWVVRRLSSHHLKRWNTDDTASSLKSWFPVTSTEAPGTQADVPTLDPVDKDKAVEIINRARAVADKDLEVQSQEMEGFAPLARSMGEIDDIGDCNLSEPHSARDEVDNVYISKLRRIKPAEEEVDPLLSLAKRVIADNEDVDRTATQLFSGVGKDSGIKSMKHSRLIKEGPPQSLEEAKAFMSRRDESFWVNIDQLQREHFRKHSPDWQRKANIAWREYNKDKLSDALKQVQDADEKKETLRAIKTAASSASARAKSNDAEDMMEVDKEDLDDPSDMTPEEYARVMSYDEAAEGESEAQQDDIPVNRGYTR